MVRKSGKMKEQTFALRIFTYAQKYQKRTGET